ncbi:DUF456 domain-containing protein [Bacteroides oleiciplenus]|uniref:DUF456 domain-containing protein n=2 Tax=Bacteroides oleiciplenus TaxID=626931 RepID=K9EHN1_9BACE|nr:DUF456 domain-containing protein [Bacteroides oleiciplenus]EKU90437.1 hypothetical protein HMPREF9447_01855 [Bacteroides oleiciplenus YIT 12058]RGN39465.1 DUF456 domain-containing protein [Bacteroides oleiciplenus]
MIDIILITLGGICLIIGLLGCIIPMIPGPPVSYAGLLLLHITDKVQFSASQLLFWLLLVVVVQVLDYFTPIIGSKYSGGTKWGSWGCLIGSIVGIVFFSPWGIIIGPFGGAFIGELLGDRSAKDALKSGIGALMGFLIGTVFKVVICGYFIWCFVKAIVVA